MNKKIYKTKLGLRFQIHNQSLPFKDGIVTLTQEEYDWLVKNNYTGDSPEFTFIWNAKKDDFRYCMIPESEIKDGESVSNFYSTKIINKLKGVKNS